jgi:hypothetical protein
VIDKSTRQPLEFVNVLVVDGWLMMVFF